MVKPESAIRRVVYSPTDFPSTMAAEGPPLSGLVDGTGINSLIRLILAKSPKKSCCRNPSFLTSTLLSFQIPSFFFLLVFQATCGSRNFQASADSLLFARHWVPSAGCMNLSLPPALMCPDVQPREGSLHSCILAAKGCIACFPHERDGNRTLESFHVAGQSQ